MRFSFDIRRVKCNAVLSTSDSPWGANDGIRVYFLVFTGNGNYNLMISGREFPPPDVVTSYSFVAGKQLDLTAFPPANAPSWRSSLIDVGETDNVWIGVIGINEGLAYVGGGGGFSSKSAGTGVIEGFVKWVGGQPEELKDTPTSTALDVGFDQLNNALDGLNAADDCQGVAFAYELVFSGVHLFHEYLKHASGTVALTSHSLAVGGLSIANRPRTSGCGQPDYEVTLQVVRHDQPQVNVIDTVTATRLGEAHPFRGRASQCADKAAKAKVWAIMYDHETLFKPTFFLATVPMIWEVDGIEIHQLSGSMNPTKETTIPFEAGSRLQPVHIDYEILSVGGINQLKLTTRGDDGNYTVKVRLLLRFSSTDTMIFYDEDMYIEGQGMNGDQAYHDYIGCLAAYYDFVRRNVNVHLRLDPGSPVEDVMRVENNLIKIAGVLGGAPIEGAGPIVTATE
jgi:hypothetical protein